jgi:hypothetical protein
MSLLQAQSRTCLARPGVVLAKDNYRKNFNSEWSKYRWQSTTSRTFIMNDVPQGVEVTESLLSDNQQTANFVAAFEKFPP